MSDIKQRYMQLHCYDKRIWMIASVLFVANYLESPLDFSPFPHSNYINHKETLLLDKNKVK